MDPSVLRTDHILEGLKLADTTPASALLNEMFLFFFVAFELNDTGSVVALQAG